MIFSLILGILLGAVSVIFILQNTAFVTVTFLTSHLQGSLALILFLALTAGALITLLILLPSFVKDVFALSEARKQKKALEEELAATKKAFFEAKNTPQTPS